MQRIIIACILTLLVNAKANAGNMPTVFGIAHLATEVVSGEGSKEGFSVKSRSSRLGVRGKNTFKGNLTGIYRFEFQIDMADDNNGDDFVKSRNMYAGITDKKLGTLLVGRHDSAMKKAIGIKIFSDTVAEMTTIMGKDVKLYNRANNTVYYQSPRLFCIQLLASVSALENGDSKNLFDIQSIAITFKKNNIYAGLANEKAEAGQKGNRITLGYKFSGHQVGAGYEFGKYASGAYHKAFVINGIAKLTDLYKIKATCGKRMAEKDETAYGIAAVRDLGGKSELYLLYHRDTNDNTSVDEQALSLGMKYVF
ncbi:MAG TPA: porin [Gammaproteobacteria bacterium]|nr:porin [Gammaproteobacteria bacterium]